MNLLHQSRARSNLLIGLLFSVAAVAVVTAGVFLLRPIAPVLSLGVLYVIAVVVVAVVFGLVYAIPVSIASMLTFNFFFLPPEHSLALHESSNWIALAVYLVTAVVVSDLATRSRRLAHKAVEAETLRQSDAVKAAILQAVSHDLRSPLTAIRAASEGLDNRALTLTQSDRDGLSETIRTEVQRLERLVENLLDLSRLEAGPAQRHPEIWTIDTLVANALDEIGPEANRVTVTVTDKLPPTQVDGAHIERTLVNLLENALKYSSPTDPVELAASEEDQALLVRVRDHGPGVDVADRERIFQAFERGAGDRRGTGLGLAIARGFAEANGGRVWLEPSPAARGATFVLTLPVADLHATLA